MSRTDDTTTVIGQMETLADHHHYALDRLYRALMSGDGAADGASTDYWLGTVKGLEAAMDLLGVEHEKFDPLRFL